jgi:hypothetical protein
MRVAVISHACVLQINRCAYRALAAEDLDVHLLVPDHFVAEGRDIIVEAPLDDDPPLRALAWSRWNPRTYRIHGLAGALDAIRPDVVHLDVDPLSVLAV